MCRVSDLGLLYLRHPCPCATGNHPIWARGSGLAARHASMGTQFPKPAVERSRSGHLCGQRIAPFWYGLGLPAHTCAEAMSKHLRRVYLADGRWELRRPRSWMAGLDRTWRLTSASAGPGPLPSRDRSLPNRLMRPDSDRPSRLTLNTESGSEWCVWSLLPCRTNSHGSAVGQGSRRRRRIAARQAAAPIVPERLLG